MWYTTVTVVIGNNIGGKPMPQDVWREFRDATEREIVAILAGWTVQTGPMAGEWLGTPELSEVFYGYGRPVHHLTSEDLTSRLADLAYQYGQEAIACAFSDSPLVKASNPIVSDPWSAA